MTRDARAVVALLLGIAAAGGALPLWAQDHTEKLPDNTPRLVVVPFHSGEKGAGVQTANALRDRLTHDNEIKKLYVVPRPQIDAVLTSSGFNVDSAPDPVTAKQLASLLRADEYIDGTVTKTGKGYRVDARMVLSRDNSMVQPLPPAEAPKLGDAVAQISKSLTAARKQLDPVRKCEDALRNNKPQDAVTQARAAIAAYPESTLGRICLANAYAAMKQPPDSIIAVASKVTEIDPRNKPALTLLAQAYKDAGNKDKASETLTRLLAADPKNVRLQQQVVADLAQQGKVNTALPIIDSAVAQNPGDPDLVRLQWLVHLTTKDWKGAIPIGEQMVKLDTAAADTTFYQRLAIAYLSDSQPQKAAETTARAVAKFPKNATLWSMHAQMLHAAGQNQQANEAIKRALTLNPKAEHGWLRLAQAQYDQGQPDSALASLRQALANGEDKNIVGQFVLVMGNKAYKDAAASKKPEDFRHAIQVLSAADSLAPSPPEKYVLGVSQFSLGDALVRQNQTAKDCDAAQEAQTYFNDAQMNIMAGAETDKQTAGQLLGYLQQYNPVVDAQIKRFCKKGKKR